MSVDNSRFGQQYLEKFGWTAGSGSGLGVSGQGRLSHISVGQKLNLLGIGGGGNNDHGDVSWEQNRDYELMLKRLNTTTTSAGGDEGEDEDEDEDGERVRAVSMVPDGFVRAGAGVSKVMDGKTATDASIQEIDVDEEERKRLRKERKQRRKEKATAKAKAKAKANIENYGVSLDAAPFSAITDTDTPSTVLSSPPPHPVPPSSTTIKPSRRLAYVTASRT